MIIRINLLPHREEKRRARRQQFYSLLGLVSVFACVLVLLGASVLSSLISRQNERNDFLRQQIVVLNKQIEQIKHLKEQTQALLARKQIIESLQQDRTESLRLMSSLVSATPEGIYLKSLKQDGAIVDLSGYAQSSARVSVLMRNIEASEWFEQPTLGEVKAVSVDKQRTNEFSLRFRIKRIQQNEGGK